jgi:4-amino-4-deoxy-L-arabinose transferase-like glycosyltransferase
MLAVSLSWVALYTFTPASDRPYVDGSTNNSAISMVFGYNGLERFGISVPGSVTSGPGVSGGTGRGTAPGGGPGGTGAGTGTGQGGPGAGTPGGVTPGGRLTGASTFGQGWTKLLGSEFGSQAGWLYPLAVLALIFGLLWTWRTRRTDQVRAGFVMWGIWLVTFGLIFSTMSSIPHTAYVASLAPPLAALPAAGIVMFWRYFRAGDTRGWLLPVAVAAEVAWVWFLWRDFTGFLPWVRILALVAGAAGISIMVLVRLTRLSRGRLLTVGLSAGVGAMLVAPAAWAGSVLDARYAGSSFNATAGPASGMGGFGGGGGGGPAGGNAAAEDAFRDFADRPGGTGNGAGADGRFRGPGAGRTGAPGGSGGGAGGMMGATTALSGSEQQIYRYVSAHRGGASYLLAVSSWTEASPYIEATGQEVMPMGGFSGSVPEPTLVRVKQLVKTGQLKFFLLNGSGGGFGGGGPEGGRDATASTIESWVQSSCQTVPAQDYAGSSTSTLYACSSRS